jgi:hypothetical protein
LLQRRKQMIIARIRIPLIQRSQSVWVLSYVSSLKDGCELGNGYEAVADNAGNGLLSTGNGKVNPTIW